MKIEFDGKTWHWVEKDKELIKVIGQVKDIRKALEHLTNSKRRGVIQAGGALGVWPWYLAQEF